MSGPRTFVAVLILFVVLCVCGVGVGALPRNQKLDSNAPGVQGLSKRLTQPLVISDIGPATPFSCLQSSEFVVAAGANCIYGIRPSTSPFGIIAREVDFTLVSGTSVDLELKQTGSLTARRSIPSTKPIDLTVYKDGGTLTVTCKGATGCRLKLK